MIGRVEAAVDHPGGSRPHERPERVGDRLRLAVALRGKAAGKLHDRRQELYREAGVGRGFPVHADQVDQPRRPLPAALERHAPLHPVEQLCVTFQPGTVGHEDEAGTGQQRRVGTVVGVGMGDAGLGQESDARGMRPVRNLGRIGALDATGLRSQDGPVVVHGMSTGRAPRRSRCHAGFQHGPLPMPPSGPADRVPGDPGRRR